MDIEHLLMYFSIENVSTSNLYRSSFAEKQLQNLISVHETPFIYYISDIVRANPTIRGMRFK